MTKIGPLLLALATSTASPTKTKSSNFTINVGCTGGTQALNK
jgi:hypothetical protein